MIIPINFKNPIHRKDIMILSKNNNFYINDLNFCINYIYPTDNNYNGFFIINGTIPNGFLIYYTRPTGYISDITYLLIDKQYINLGYEILLINKLIKLNVNNVIVIKSDNDNWYMNLNFINSDNYIKKIILKYPDPTKMDEKGEMLTTYFLQDIYNSQIHNYNYVYYFNF